MYASEGGNTLKDGGNMAYAGGGNLDGQLQTHWGGRSEAMSYNPFLPGNGETVEFKGDMHNGSKIQGNSGIGITYGGSPVEVEGGEPATVLQDGGGQENLTVFGNLKIPKDMLQDPKANGKKFKNYVKDLSKKEESSNKAIEKNMKGMDELNPITSFDKLRQSSYKANLMGNNMKLKDYAGKKQDAAAAQKAINDTAEEYGLVADDLARGKYKVDKGVFKASNAKANYGADIPMYQDSGEVLPKLKRKTRQGTEDVLTEGVDTTIGTFEGTGELIGEYEDKQIFHTAVLGTIQIKRGRLIAIGTPKSESDY